MTPDRPFSDDSNADRPNPDGPDAPKDLDTTADRLRATLRDVADTAEPTDGLHRLRAAVSPPVPVSESDPADRSSTERSPGEPSVIKLEPVRSGSSPWLRRLVPVAAVLVTVVGIGALLTTVGGRSGDSSADRASAGQAIAADDDEATTSEAPATSDTTSTTEVSGTTRPNDPELPGPSTDPVDSRTIIGDPWEFPEQLDPLDGLTFALVVDQRSVVAGSAVGARLQVTNTTGDHRTIHECTAIQTGIAFVPADAPETPVPVPEIIDCYQTSMLEIPGGETVDLPFAADGYLGPLTARRSGAHRGFTSPLGALPPGDYLATAVMPGSDVTARVQVPVTITEPLCDGFSDELARAVVGEPQTDATTAAQKLGFALRPVIVDDVGQATTRDLRCDRVNVIVFDGNIVDIAGVY